MKPTAGSAAASCSSYEPDAQPVPRPGVDVIDCTPNLRAIRDQGHRGTCVAFATSAVHEYVRALRRGALADDLCVEQLFWRCKQIDANTRDGTNFTSARDALSDPGQCDEAHWPYTPVRDLTAPTRYHLRQPPRPKDARRWPRSGPTRRPSRRS